jgi:hypothetical protein
VKAPRKALPSYDVNQATGWFLLFVAPSVGGSYLRMFSPAFVVLGFGLAVSVAPLTTALRANIGETSLVPLINEQGEKEKGRDEREFSWC